MIPVARTEKLLIQDVGGELIVYDQETNASHCLNQMAARVWELCDGRNTVNDLANLLEEELGASDDPDVDMRGLIWLTLEELERYNLIKEYRKEPIAVSNISRRKVIKTATLAGGFAIGSMFPLVRSIVAPEPAVAGGSGEQELPPCEIILEMGAECTVDSLTVNGKTTFFCTDNGCGKKGGVCKARPNPNPNADPPIQCVCVKDKNCVFDED